ncbi:MULTISPECIES: tripartite tricarboxylate transporter permease [unclassified Paenibacillus]|uniref:tripartite tricarboxylate transporter permease n=1 Tax=unclassified Paenibacillus TaxID=185978 RepID=UPI001AE2D9D0|nr:MULTISPECIES: tripartite tricarboxylate transporter permease [unclassified Paenibacillus]MBP1156948.1 putative tricarboxylic transport membrane protein [Paenibacillus sp. PvP091]MBP1172313.1 putative tricarboxylic transport membrane protein [Paenibacillus sp. PvR098]MBP2438694.1 putative tricarboxylic transport membrane protein [Paenibacillus sp. PvP052]
MGILQSLLDGFVVALSFQNILAAAVGAVLGIIVGGLPGLGSVTGVALLLPITFTMDPTTGIIMLAGIYYGCMYGGSYTAILVNIPGESSSITTALDGYPLARKGLAGKALFTANLSSFIGGTIGIIFLTFMGPVLAKIGLSFGPPEIACVILLALCSISLLFGENRRKGLLAAFIGILLATIGVDPTLGQSRFTFGSINLLNGISFVALIIGMFGFCQIIELMLQKIHAEYNAKITIRESLLDKNEVKRIMAPSIRTGILGSFVGILPGAGATTGSMFSYILEKKVGKNKEQMGKGALEGVAAAESGNNATAVGAFAPLLSLGIPSSGTTAVLLGGLIMWGLKPGPLLFTSNPDFVWGLISSMYIGNLISLVASLAIIPLLIYFIRIPNAIMIPLIIIFCVLGAFTDQNSMFDVWVMLIAGVVAFILSIHRYPIAPLLMAFVLTPMFETSVRQSFDISNGDPAIFVRGPITITILSLIVLFAIAPFIVKYLIRNRKSAQNNETIGH